MSVWLRMALLGWALALAACSSFPREWKAATAHGQSATVSKADPFSGAWDGKWTSEKHKMLAGGEAGDRLRCLFTKQDDTHYRAKFYANWLCFASGYEVTFMTERHGRTLLFRGEHDLGAIFGGVYHYNGRVTPEHFSARFLASFDNGTFEMDRVR